MTDNGRVSFVGAGCGDPRLLTLRSAELLSEADLVLYDADVHPDVLAFAPEDAERELVEPSVSPASVAARMAREAKSGKHVVRVAWGDSMLFGRGDVEVSGASRGGATLEVSPGIGPLVAIGAFAGVPLTLSSDASPSVAALTVTKGHETLHDWDKLATATDTLAMVVDAASVGEVARSLVFYGRKPEEPVVLIGNVSLPSQIVHETTLEKVPLSPPPPVPRVVFVVGGKARRRSDIAWLESRPLFGKRVLVTRARGQAASTAKLLRERGADPVIVPTIEIQPPSDPAPLIDAVDRLHERYRWVLFTSANGVERMWAEVRRQGKDARAFGAAKIGAIGPSTARALEALGLVPDVVAKEHKGEGLATDLLAAMGEERGTVLLARAEIARDALPDALSAAGCEVHVVPAYKTRTPPRPLLSAVENLLDSGGIDVVTFTSSSTVQHLADALGADAARLMSKVCVASIGPITTATAQSLGIRVDVVADAYTVPGLIDALEKHFEKKAI